jgi:O-antigen ligase
MSAHGVAVRSQPGGLAFAAARAIVVGALVLATLAFGAVQAWAWGALIVFVAAALVVWGAANVRAGALRIAWSPLYLPALGLLLLGLAQYYARLTSDTYATRESLVKLSADVLLFFLAVQLWSGPAASSRRRLALSATCFAGALALFAIIQFLASPARIYWLVKPRWGGWIFGPYVNHNDYAGLMEMLIPLGIGYLVFLRLRPRSRGTGLAAFAVLIALASVLLSGSRGGLVAILIEFAVWPVVLCKYVPGGSRRRWAAAGLAGVAAAAALFLWLAPGPLAARLGSVAALPKAPEATLGERVVVARDALTIFTRHPLIGTGLGSFSTVYPQYRSFPSDLDWDHAHNDYAEALAEAGAAGGLLIATALYMFFRFAFRGLRERLRHGAGWISLGAALGCCGLLVHSLVDFNLHIPANAAWFSLLAGIAVSRVAPAPAEEDGT